MEDPGGGDCQELIDSITHFVATCNLPRPLWVALGRCLRRRWRGTPYSSIAADILVAQQKGDDALHAALQRHRISEQWLWIRAPRGWDWSKTAPPEAFQYPPPSGGGRW